MDAEVAPALIVGKDDDDVRTLRARKGRETKGEGEKEEYVFNEFHMGRLVFQR